MFTPKKESCLRVVRRPSAAGFLVPGAGMAALADGEREGTQLRFRDKALPDRLVIAGLICDTVVVVYALIFCYWVRFQSRLAEVGVPEGLALRNYAGYIGFGALALILMLASRGIYERAALLRYRFVAPQIVRVCLVWAAGLVATSLIFKFQPPISRFYVLIATAITPGMLLGWRWIFHRFLGRAAVAMSLRQRVLFVGWNEESEKLTRHFQADTGSAYEVVGCIGAMRARFQREPTERVLGQYRDLVDVLHRYSIDMVVLTDVNAVRGDIVGLANTCERELVAFKVIPSYFQILVSGLHLETVGGTPVLGVSRLPLDRFANILLKRVVDMVGAIVGLILSAPLIAIFGALVRRESRGPIFYRQRRIGRSGLEFDILKIRSMDPHAEPEGKAAWTRKDDPRRLRIGAFMRRWNIDETPQFWNVLTGEMSLVGPRPERPELIRDFKHDIPHYNARHNAKPGMTGWAQVNGLRGDTDLAERIKCDLWYLENWSLTLDFQIMFMTFFRRENAG
jgi:exopolysaccharide biosynthesis polyprenyl glycosylphosphotransferase